MFDKKNLFQTSLVYIFLLVSFNAIYNSCAIALGATENYSTFLMLPVDLFGDYFKAIFSFASPNNFDFNISGFGYLSNILQDYISNNPYRHIEKNSGLPINLNGMPLSTMLALFNLYLMKWINPVYLFISFLFLIFLLYGGFCFYVVKNKLDCIYLFISILISYPMLFMIVRGHWISALTTLAILFFLASINFKKLNTGLFFLALACSFRPNCVIFFFFLFIFGQKPLLAQITKIFIKFLVFFLLIFWASLYINHIIYPLYTFKNFITGVKIYHAIYAAGGSGIYFGSSLLGAIKMFVPYEWIIEKAIFWTSAFVLVFSTRQYLLLKIEKSSFLFIICSIYCLCTSVFADYYLGIFIAPIVFLYLERQSFSNVKVDRYITFICCILLLGPKNYFYIDNHSFQVVLNPLILLLGTIFILANSLKRPSSIIFSK